MADGGLKIRPADACRWDCAALGEVMLRFDPGDGRVRNARAFQVWEGGGEYNVARAMRKAFGLRATVVTAFPDNDVGRLAEDLILQGGVDVGHVIWRDYDGVGRNTRVGLNFTERGFGIRPALGVSDRGHSAASQIAPGEVDWDGLFGREGVRWFHTGGIFAALAPRSPHVVLEAVQAARRHGTIVSFDLNYRASLWKALGDPAEVQRLNREIARNVDVMFGDPLGFKTCLGYDAPADFPAFAETCVKEFGFAVVAGTRRTAQSASANDWGAVLWSEGQVYESATRRNLDVFDRVGGGDAFASGVIYALLQGLGSQAAVDYGAAHGALAMTTPGDASMADLREIEAAIGAEGAAVIR
jgi:2-dehydro-3-deoxygluconokinase